MANLIQLRDADTNEPVYPITDVSAIIGIKAYCNVPVASAMPSGGFLPNVYYDLGELAGNTTFLFDTSDLDATILNVWHFVFETPATAPTITWPAEITDWIAGSAPTVAAGKRYEVSVIGGVAAYLEM